MYEMLICMPAFDCLSNNKNVNVIFHGPEVVAGGCYRDHATRGQSRGSCPQGEVGPLEKTACAGFFNQRPDGPLDFPPWGVAGGGRVTTPFISAPVHRRAKRKTAFESLLKIFPKLLQ